MEDSAVLDWIVESAAASESESSETDIESRVGMLGGRGESDGLGLGGRNNDCQACLSDCRLQTSVLSYRIGMYLLTVQVAFLVLLFLLDLLYF